MKMFDSLALGNRIRLLRNQKQMSQKLLADCINVKQSSISDLENGKHKLFSIGKLGLIADNLDVTLDELLQDSLITFVKEDTYIGKLKIQEKIETIYDERILIAFNSILESYIKNYRH